MKHLEHLCDRSHTIYRHRQTAFSWQVQKEQACTPGLAAALWPEHTMLVSTQQEVAHAKACQGRTLDHKWIQLSDAVAFQRESSQASSVCQARWQALNQAPVSPQFC